MPDTSSAVFDSRPESPANQSESDLNFAGRPNTRGTENILVFKWTATSVFEPGSPAWFWTPEWQKMEAEATDDISAGRVVRFADYDEFTQALDELFSDADL